MGKIASSALKQVKICNLSQIIIILENSQPSENQNQEMEFNFDGPLPLTWGTKKYILVCVDQFSKLALAQITSSTSAKSIISFLSKYIALHGIPRTIRTDQGSGFISKEVREFCQKHNINVIFSPVGDHRATDLVERLIRTVK